VIEELASHLRPGVPVDPVASSTVRFTACSSREWLDTFPQYMADHAERVIARFHP
jgi:hypothetical protein